MKEGGEIQFTVRSSRLKGDLPARQSEVVRVRALRIVNQGVGIKLFSGKDAGENECWRLKAESKKLNIKED